MFNEKSLNCGRNRSEIRELFEYGKTLKNSGKTVCDFTLGNPSTTPPSWVLETLKNGLNLDGVHAYTSAQGSPTARTVIANNLSKIGNSNFSPENVILTCEKRKFQ